MSASPQSKFLHLALFAVGLLGTAAAIRHVDALPFWSWIRPKLLHVQQTLGDHDTLFFGSSRIHYGLLPSAFDAQMAALGRPTKSFNCGLSGARPHDFNVVLDWVLAQNPRTLKRAVVELHAWCRPRPTPDRNWMTDQEVEAHTLAELPRRVRSTWLATMDAGAKASNLYGVVTHTLANLFRIGQGPRLLDDLLAAGRGQVKRGATFADAGYDNPELSTMDSMKSAHAEWLANAARRDSLFALISQDEPAAELRGGFDLQSARGLAARLRAVGIEPLFVVMPSFAGNFNGRDGVSELAREEIVLALDRPRDHPSLFGFEWWQDQSHMTRAGAERFSRYLADQLVKRAPTSLR